MTHLIDTRPKMFRSEPITFVIALILIMAYGLGLLILFAWWIRTLGERLTVTETEIVMERGILSKSRTEIAIGGVRTVDVHQSLFNRMFDTGKVAVFTAGDKPEIVVSGIESPNAVRDVIRAQQAALRNPRSSAPASEATGSGLRGFSFRKDSPTDNETRVFRSSRDGYRGEIELGSIIEGDEGFVFFEFDESSDTGFRQHSPRASMVECKAMIIKAFA
jgi:uncharacterized membrane protein YdbT with pleckstrin-like domain